LAFGSHEKITKSENATVAGIRKRPAPSPESGEHVWLDRAKIAGSRQDTSGPDQIRPDPVILAGSRQDQWQDPIRSGRIPAILARSGRISSWIRSYPAILARSGRISGRIRSDQAGFRPVSVHGRIPAIFYRHSAQLPDVARFRRPAVFWESAVFRWSDSDAGIIPVT
jgi:hypothetical protein